MLFIVLANKEDTATCRRTDTHTHTHAHTERERERETDRETDIQTERQTYIHTDTCMHIYTKREIRERETDRKTEGQTHRKEGNVLFNEELNTFYLLLYGVTHMVKDHSDSE